MYFTYQIKIFTDGCYVIKIISAPPKYTKKSMFRFNQWLIPQSLSTFCLFLFFGTLPHLIHYGSTKLYSYWCISKETIAIGVNWRTWSINICIIEIMSCVNLYDYSLL